MSDRNIEDIYRLSPTQQGMLFHTLYAPASGVYIEQFNFPLTGLVDLPILERAWQTVIQRHAILRTAFYGEDRAEPLQVVYRQVTLNLEQQDWRSLPPTEQQARLGAYLKADRQRGFQLDQAPLMRIALIWLSEEIQQCIWTYHHLLLDGWSVPIILAEVQAVYSAHLQNQSPSLPPAQPYRDYIAWLYRQDRAQAEAYWRRALQGFAAPTPLVVEKLPGATLATSDQYLLKQQVLPTATAEALRARARRQHLTLNTLVVGAWALLLHHYSRQPEVVFGLTLSGRPTALPHVESRVGMFINTLPLRVRVLPEKSVLEWLGELQAQFGELRTYEYSALVDVHHWSEIPPGQPLFESVVVFENYPRHSQTQLQTVENVFQRTNYALTLVAQPQPDFILRLGYPSDRFDSATIERMLGHLQTLLEAMLTQPQQPVAALTMLTQAEQQQLLIAWNATERAPEHEHTLPELFETQVERTPEATAVVGAKHVSPRSEAEWDSSQDVASMTAASNASPLHITYAELNRRANQLAHYLRTLGVGPNLPVGVCLEASVELVIGLLGILKAGGCYVPLDPSYPPERLAFMLAEARIKVLLTTSRGLGARDWGLENNDQQPAVVCLDIDWPTIAQSPVPNPQPLATLNDLLYIIFTSGSTGRPKGSGIYQRGFINLLEWYLAEFQINSTDHFLLITSPSFDLTQKNLFAPLLTGGELHLLTAEHYDPAQISAAIAAGKITLLNCTPSAFYPLVVADQPQAWESLSTLRHVCLGGEPIQLSVIKEWLSSENCRAEISNTYGPTECTDICTCHRLHQPALFLTQAVPTGQPIRNVKVYVLDEHLHPVPIGVAGELCVAGAGVGPGYINDPALTAEKFVPNPFLSKDELGRMKDEKGNEHEDAFILHPSSFILSTTSLRLYKTGDLARWLPDGNLEFLGRLDHQVKVRGFRIELGEVEAVLGHYPGVSRCVVTVHAAAGQKQLVAYLESQAEPLSAEKLRDFLQTRLPEYMWPTIFVTLATLPLTPNGKVDRNALPAPDGQRSGLETYASPPRNPVEEVLTGIWTQVLGMERVGIHDNFFTLGGHSLLATQLISRIRAALHVELPLRTIFEAPTVARLAERIHVAQRGGTLPPLRPAQRPSQLPLSFAQQRLWFLDQLSPGSPFYNMPAMLQLSGPLDSVALQRSLNTLLARHEALRTTFSLMAGQPVQVIAASSELALPLVNLAGLPTPERERIRQQLAWEEAVRPFDLARGPLLRTRLLRLTDTEHILLLNVHHIAFDGWSLGIVLRELGSLYAAFLKRETPASINNESPLPSLSVQYADYALWQRTWLTEAVLEQQLTYWRESLAEIPILDLPTDHPRPASPSFRGAIFPFTLPGSMVTGLKQLGQQMNATLFMVLLAAFKVLLARYTGQTDVPVGTRIAGRTQTELEAIVGYFVNALVLRTDLSGRPTFREVLTRVREVALGAYAHQELPFEKLVEELQPQRDLSRQPLFQVMFVVQNAPVGQVELAGLRASLLGLPSGTAKLDLDLSLNENDEGLTGLLEYNTDLFEPATIERLVEHYRRILEGVLADPDRSVDCLPLLTPAEREQLLFTWNLQASVTLPEQSLIELFEAQVKAVPDRVAVLECGTASLSPQHLTYQALDRRTTQLAHYLRCLGVKAEVPVGVCLERSVPTLISLLSIFKAGGVYVPLDPHYPPAHLAFIVHDTQLSILLTVSQLLAHLPVVNEKEEGLKITQPPFTICLDRDWPSLASTSVPEEPSVSQLQSLLSPDTIACLVYTSGSTGRPKGVAVPHRQLLNRFDWMWQAFPFEEGEIIGQRTTVNFSVSLWELLGGVVQGVPTVIVPDEVGRDAPALLETLTVQHVTRLVVVPSLLRSLLDATQGRLLNLPRLKWCSVCGEVLPPDLVERFRTQAPHTVLINQYGASEANDITYFDTRELASPVTGPVPIGRPIRHMRFYILDDWLEPVPIGVVGHVYVGNPGLARGYLGQPDLTAEKFVPNPFLSKDELGRMKDEKGNEHEDAFILHPSSFILHPSSFHLHPSAFTRPATSPVIARIARSNTSGDGISK